MATSFRMMLPGLVVALSLVAPVMGAEPAGESPAAMAEQYTRQAADLRKSAARHAELAKMHRSGSPAGSKTSHLSIAVHCENIAKNLNAAAAESEAMATIFRKLPADTPATK